MQWLISQNVFLMARKALISALILLVAFRFLHFERADGKKVIIAVNNSKANRTIEFDKAFDKCSFIETTQDYEFDKSEMQNVKKSCY